VNSRVLKYFSRIFLVCILPCFFIIACAGTKPVTETVKFALIGNTSPDSPFTGFNETLPAILSGIENHKPQIIIHTGNALYGGSESDGIIESDIRRQLNIFFQMLKKLNTAAYTIPGDRDYYNNSPELYLEFSGKKSSYSFNYGSIHFICLSSAAAGESFIDEEQFRWLKKDLKEFRDSNAIFILTHHQLFPDEKKIKITEMNEKLHELFMKYNVKGVFSGSGMDYSEKLKDSILYINAGYTDKTKKKYNRNSNRFYLVNFYNNEFHIEPVK
jgi:3',5'-cyclic AMP phosphodiesterase CpdA